MSPRSATPNGKRPRSDKGQARLTQRDLDLVRYVGEQTACCFDQVQLWLARHPDSQAADPNGLSASRTSAILARLQKHGLLICRKVLSDDLKWIWCTARGLFHAHLACRFHEPALADLDHLYWINETRAQVEASDGTRPGFRWESERLIRATREQLRVQQKEEPELWIPWEYRGTHRVDALLRYWGGTTQDAVERVCGIEVELHRKSYETWRRIFLDLLLHHHDVRYYVSPEIKGALLGALERFQREEPGQERRQHITVHDVEEHVP